MIQEDGLEEAYENSVIILSASYEQSNNGEMLMGSIRVQGKKAVTMPVIVVELVGAVRMMVEGHVLESSSEHTLGDMLNENEMPSISMNPSSSNQFGMQRFLEGSAVVGQSQNEELESGRTISYPFSFPIPPDIPPSTTVYFSPQIIHIQYSLTFTSKNYPS
jgi:hypothetical protein